jgi:hypothetical protein
LCEGKNEADAHHSHNSGDPIWQSKPRKPPHRFDERRWAKDSRRSRYVLAMRNNEGMKLVKTKK